ncbi:MAG: ABC transporter ATP-binding protein [Acidimicrobiales bacterium]
MTTPPPVVDVADLSCHYGPVRAVSRVTFTIDRGEFVAIEGPSGSGKSTLLHIIAGIETPTSGTVLVAGHNLTTMNDRDRSVFRREHIGVIFQLYDLIPTLTAWQNVAVPGVLGGQSMRSLEPRARELLDTVGLGPRADHTPNELSGGEQQRVAIGRALMNEPDIVLADEPTGALDSVTGDEILDTLHTLTERGHTVVMVTHEPRAASFATRSIGMLDGHTTAPAPRSMPL